MTYRNSLTPVARVRRAWHLPVASPLSVVRAVTPHSAEALPVAARLFDYFVSKEWLSARPFLNRVPAPEGGVLFFARPKKSTQKKGRPAGTPFGLPALLAVHRARQTALPCADWRVRASLRAPFGPFRRPAAMLGAPDGSGIQAPRVVRRSTLVVGRVRRAFHLLAGLPLSLVRAVTRHSAVVSSLDVGFSATPFGAICR